MDRDLTDLRPCKITWYEEQVQQTIEAFQLETSQSLTSLSSGWLRAQISISDLMCCPLTLMPYSISSIDGFFPRTYKGQSMNYMIKDADNAPLSSPSQRGLI